MCEKCMYLCVCVFECVCRRFGVLQVCFSVFRCGWCVQVEFEYTCALMCVFVCVLSVFQFVLMCMNIFGVYFNLCESVSMRFGSFWTVWMFSGGFYE